MGANSIGLPEFEIVGTPLEDSEGRSIKYVVEKTKEVKRCRKCLKKGYVGGNGYDAPRIVHDLPAHGKLVFLEIKVRRFKCNHPDCGKTFSDKFDCVGDKQQMTHRLRDYIKKESVGRTFTSVAQEVGVSISTVKRLFDEFVEENEHKLKYSPPRVMGIDENHIHKTFRFVIVDVERGMLLDMLPTNDSKYLLPFFQRMTNKQDIEVVIMDMHRPYHTLITEVIPSAAIVVDKFHVIQLVNRKMDVIRASITRPLSKSEREALSGLNHMMKANQEDIASSTAMALRATFAKYPALGDIYYLKEKIREMYSTKSRKVAGVIFLDFINEAKKSRKPMQQAANTFELWAREILNYFDYFDESESFYNMMTNAKTENYNKKINKHNADSKSLTFEQLRYKVLFDSRATKLPAFKVKQAAYSESNTFKYLTPNGFKLPDMEFVQGFGVDWCELLEELSE